MATVVKKTDCPICPILSIPPENDFCPCQQEKCAWWDEDRQKCAMAVTPPRK